LPTEHRIIVFDKTELIEALGVYCAKAGRALPDDEVHEMTLADDSEVMISIKDPQNRTRIEFTPHEVGVALIQFCIETRLPVPKWATKSLEVCGETVSCHFRIEHEPQRGRWS
jgi:hypothetical protein